jgi:hypothetical protein
MHNFPPLFFVGGILTIIMPSKYTNTFLGMHKGLLLKKIKMYSQICLQSVKNSQTFFHPKPFFQ